MTTPVSAFDTACREGILRLARGALAQDDRGDATPRDILFISLMAAPPE